MKNEYTEVIKFVDENVYKKSDNAQEFTKGIGTILSYLQLKGPVDDSIVKYFEALTDCSTELMSIKSKGLDISTSGFFKEQKEAKKVEEEPSRSYHYSSGC